MKGQKEKKIKKALFLLFFGQLKGNTLLLVMVFTAIFLIIFGGLLSLTMQERKLNLAQVADAEALQVAEAGLNYYRWHLAHDSDEYLQDTGEHEYKDMNGVTVGHYNIEITPPATSSTVVTIRSTGWLDEYPNRERVAEAKYGLPSLAHYAFLTNTNVWFGNTEHLNGEMHSNGGIRMDGTTNARMTSAKETYSYDSQTKPGIWGTGGPTDLWDFPVPTIDFSLFTVDLSEIKSEAQAHGFYQRKSNKSGYYLIFNPNGTFDLYEIKNLAGPSYCQWDAEAPDVFYNQEQIGATDNIGNFPIPANGLIFIEDNIWVQGTINGKVTLASARFPDQSQTNTTIYINGNLSYLARDGNHSLGLMAQKDILVPRHAPSDLTIDAIMLAQKGHVMRHYYCDQIVKNSIEVYGGIITNKVWTWSWVACETCTVVIDGYTNTYSIYDSRLTYSPPPSFPTSGEYTFISWEEVQ